MSWCTFSCFTGLFLLMWTPYAIVMMWYIVTNDAYIHPLLASIPSMVTKTSSCFIPLVYLGRSKHIRKAVLDMYPWLRSTNIQNGAISEHVEDLNLNGVVLFSKNKTTTHMATTKTWRWTRHCDKILADDKRDVKTYLWFPFVILT